MTLTPLASRNPATVREALVRWGMHESRATAASHDLGVFLQHVAEPPQNWVLGRGSVRLDRPLVVGILNVTPDSFSDGGQFLDPTAAIRHGADMIEAGADMLDIGAESTRPGRPDPVPADEEWKRLAPVLEEIAARFPDVPVSVDTVKAETAERALATGAWAINDVSGLRFDSRISEVCAAHGAGLILMHSRGSFSEMATYDLAQYDDVSAETIRELADAVARASSSGVRNESIVLDPGLGFAKNPGQNFEVLRSLPALVALGFPVMVGPSRKRFLSAGGEAGFERRDEATASVCVAAYMLGANLFRVHAVREVRQALDGALSVRTS